MNENGMIELELEGVNQGATLHILAYPNELADVGSVAHLYNFLSDDGSLIKIFIGKMRGGADHFHALVPGLMVGFGAFEGRQKTMVDVDDFVFPFADKTAAEYLHETGQYHNVNAVLLQYFLYLCFGGFFSGAVINLIEWYTKLSGHRLVNEVIGNDDGYVAFQFAILMFEE